MTQALIYRRFSTDEQEFGSSDTLARQLERSQAMAKAKGWTVTEVLTDKGRSAYKGHHLLPDAELGKFMTRLRSGEFAKGTVLIADNLSRLSRRPVDEALAWIYEINAAGITIALADKSEIHRANPDMAEIIARTLSLGGAHKSSQEKSEMTLLSKARLWKSAETRTGKWVNLANRPPSWLVRKPTLDGFDIIKERADVVRMIYQMSADGVGVVSIAGHLNSMDPPVPPFANAIKAKGEPHTWGRSSVRQILQTPNVEGDFRPVSGVFKGQVIHDFYPRIVDADIVARARSDLAARRKVAGKSASSGSTNLFAGFTSCGVCGRRGNLSSSVQKGRPYAYVRCEAAAEKRCSNVGGYAYAKFEETVLDLMLDLALDDRFFAVAGELRAGRVRKAEIEKLVADKRARRQKMMVSFDLDDADAVAVIAKAKEEIDTLMAELVEVEAAIQQASGRVGNIEHLRRVGDIRAAAKSDDDATRKQARSKLRLAMKGIVQSVDIERDQDGVKVFTVILKGGIMAVRINDKGKVMEAVSDALGKPLWSYLPPEDQEQLMPLIKRIERMAA